MNDKRGTEAENIGYVASADEQIDEPLGLITACRIEAGALEEAQDPLKLAFHAFGIAFGQLINAGLLDGDLEITITSYRKPKES